MKTPTKADLAAEIAALRTENSVLRAQLNAQRAQTTRTTKRPPYATIFKREDAFAYRANLAKANFLDHPWCVEPCATPRGTAYLVY